MNPKDYQRWVTLYGSESIPGIYQHLEVVTGRMRAAGTMRACILGYIDGMLDTCKALAGAVSSVQSQSICEALAKRLEAQQ